MHTGLLTTHALPAVPRSQPPVDEVTIDSVTSHQVIPGLHLIRGTCTQRFKYEVEYNMKRGTTDNSYLLKVGHAHCQQAIAWRAVMTQQPLTFPCGTGTPQLHCTQGQGAAVLVDVPNEAYMQLWGELNKPSHPRDPARPTNQPTHLVNSARPPSRLSHLQRRRWSA